MEKINKYLWVMAASAMFVICIPLFAGGINNNAEIKNASMLITDNKTNINQESETVSHTTSSGNKNTVSKYKNTKPKNGEFKMKNGANVEVKKEHIPKEKIIEAIANGDKKVTEEDIIAIANEYNMNVTELKNETMNGKKF